MKKRRKGGSNKERVGMGSEHAQRMERRKGGDVDCSRREQKEKDERGGEKVEEREEGKGKWKRRRKGRRKREASRWERSNKGYFIVGMILR